MITIDALAWPCVRLGEALEALAQQDGAITPTIAAPVPPASIIAPPRDRSGASQRLRIGAWIKDAAQHLGVEAEPVMIPYPDLTGALTSSAPAILQLPPRPSLPADPPRFLALARSDGARLRLLGPDLALHDLAPERLAAVLAAPLEARVGADLDACLDAADLAGSRRARARRALFDEALAGAEVASIYLLRPAPGGSLLRALRGTSIARDLALQTAAHAAQLALVIAGWAILGRAVFADHLERGWLVAALGLFASAIPLQAFEQWYAGRAGLDAGARVKQRLLDGALALSPEEVRGDGAGRHLARVIEAESLQAALLGGAAPALLGLLEIIAAAAVLAAGAAGLFHALLLALFCGALAILLRDLYRRRRAWTEARIALTNDTVERLVGHTTRVAQEPPETWHDDEDRELAAYFTRTEAMDRATRRYSLLLARGFLLVGFIGLAPTIARAGASPSAVAVTLGGLLLAHRAFGQLASSLVGLVDIAVGWKVVGPLFRAAQRTIDTGSPAFALASPEAATATDEPEPLLDARALRFRYPARSEDALHGCDLAIYSGDRVLLEGASGGGKSTLGALLAGLRAPTSGTLLARGLDRSTLGRDGWRRRVVAAPQFHDNHVFSGSLAYNLLMGRGWPAPDDDLDHAEALCRELGLGALLERMPAGLKTLVGESGWQLSHGERSRMFIARALLQEADVLVLDESFAALDPETLERCLKVVLARAKAAIVIAHP